MNLLSLLLVLIAVILFGLIIFIHEFGHFFTAKLSGILVKEFAIGMGPKIFSKQKGETRYSLRLFPIGGFCDMEGENDESENPRAFNNKPIWKRMIVVVTGAILNILFGIVLMSIVLVQMDLLPTMTISQFADKSTTQTYGIEVNDQIVDIDGYAIYSEKDLSFAYATADPSNVSMTVMRGDEKIVFENMNLPYEEVDGRKFVTLDFYVYGEEPTFLNIIKKTFVDSLSIVRMVIASLEGLLTGEFGLNEISGPIGATKAISDATSQGLADFGFVAAINNLLFMMAVLTINLGVFNLLPFPALDGGRLVFLLIELIFRKPVPQKYEAYVNTAGFVILIGFMIVVAFKDVFQLFM